MSYGFSTSDTAGKTYEGVFLSIGNISYSLTDGAVPEPASWAMMIGGMGMVGAAMRRRKSKVSTKEAFA